MAALLLLFILSVFILKCYISLQPAVPSDYYPTPGGPWFCIKRFMYLMLLPYFPQKNHSYRALLEKGIRETPADPSAFTRELEDPQTLVDSPYVIDSVYFTAFTEDAKSFIITRVARRAKNLCAIWLFMRLDSVGDFEHPEHPNTMVTCEGNNSWSAGGLSATRLEPYKTWRISFDGLLRKGPFRYSENEDVGESMHVKFIMNWTNSTDVFDFAHDLHPNLIADMLAMGPLTMEFLSTVQKANEEHDRYEQWGFLQANVSIRNDQEYQISMSGIRSHSYGIRNWADFHRYVMFLIHFENGASMHLNIISLHTTNRHSIVGYMFFPDGKKTGIEWSDAHLSLLADDRVIKENYKIRFTAGGQTFNVSATLDPKNSPIIHNPSLNNLKRPNVGITIECIATFKMEDGTQGHGLVEFFYEYNDCATCGH